MDLERVKSVILSKAFIPVAAFIGADLIMIAFAVYLGSQTFAQYDSLTQKRFETESLQQQVDLVRANKSLLSDRIEQYNNALDTLIPDTESYFSVIAAFEQLGARTGVSVESYSINLAETTEEKLSLDLNIYGEPESIVSLLRDYHYISGRFLTNEDVYVTFGDETSIDFTVNLVHKTFTSGGVGLSDPLAGADQSLMDMSSVGPVTSISQEDVAQMEKILQAMN